MAESKDRRWEYQFVQAQPYDSAAPLSGLGAKGWRVVHIITHQDGAVVHALMERELVPPPARSSA